MLQSLWRRFGRRVTDNAIRSHAREGGLLDVGLGFALMKDRRVSWKTKLLALLIGGGIIGLLVLLELPVETLVASFMLMLGVVLDGLVDGLEFVAGPILLAALFLPRLAPQPLVQQIRAERAGAPIVPPLPAPEMQNPARVPQRDIAPPLPLAR